MREEAMREWMKKIIEKYWIDEKKLEELDKEIGACRQKERFWDSYIKYLNSIDRSSTSYEVEVILEWCKEEKEKLSEELKKVSKERAKRDLCESMIDFFKLKNRLNKEG
jgi:hypothetical protein